MGSPIFGNPQILQTGIRVAIPNPGPTVRTLAIRGLNNLNSLLGGSTLYMNIQGRQRDTLIIRTPMLIQDQTPSYFLRFHMPEHG